MDTAPASHDAVIAQLDRILQSPTFQGAERSRALLRFLVEQSVGGRADSLKEYTLGSEALGRGDAFDPRTDPIVRAEASRLRARLERYYAREGQADATLILLPKGSYVPIFKARVPQDANAPLAVDSQADVARQVARGWIPWLALGGAAGVAALTLAVLTRTTPQAEQPLMQFDVELRSGGVLASDVGSDVIVSPDGTRMVFVSRGTDGATRLQTRRLDQLAISELPGTEGARVPFFSPDGDWVGFWASGALKRTAVGGGTPVHLCDAVDLMGASWGEDGYIVAALGFGQLWRVAAWSGDAELLVDLAGELIDPRWPQILPDGKHVLFTAVGPGGPDTARLDVLSLVDGTRKTVARGGTYGRYLPNGYLTYVNQGALFAVPLDVKRMEADGRPPVPVLESVLYSSTFGFAHLDISRTGTLIYRRSTARGQLIAAWMEAGGRVEPWLSKPGEYTFPRVSPDGRLAFVSLEGGIKSVWVRERDSERTTRVSASPVDFSPIWSPDGRVLVVGGGKGLHWLAADGSGSPQPLTGSTAVQIPWSFSPDGTRVAYHELSATTGFDLWTVPVRISDNGLAAGEPEPFLKTAGFTTYPAFSPDGRWVSYASGAYGKWEVYVRPFPDNGMREVQVSQGGGRISEWLPNGRELLYRTDDHRLMVTTYSVHEGAFVTEETREWSPRRLADTGVLSNFGLAPDGTRVVALLPAEVTDEQSPNHVTFALHFAEEVHRRVQSRGR